MLIEASLVVCLPSSKKNFWPNVFAYQEIASDSAHATRARARKTWFWWMHSGNSLFQTQPRPSLSLCRLR